MRKSKKVETNTKVPLTLRVPQALDANIEAYCVTKGMQKSNFIIGAIRLKLQQENLRPDQLPHLSVSYLD